MKKIVFFVGESGCGKTYLQEKLMQRYPTIYTRITSTVSRPPRPGEVDGVSYHFLKSAGEFRRLIMAGKFLQHVEYGGNYYGTQLKEYEQPQDVGIFVCTPEGIMDTINAVRSTPGLAFDFEIVYMMATKKLLADHGIDQERIDRGNITENFTNRYFNDEFEGVPLMVVTKDQINHDLIEKVHRTVG